MSMYSCISKTTVSDITCTSGFLDSSGGSSAGGRCRRPCFGGQHSGCRPQDSDSRHDPGAQENGQTVSFQIFVNFSISIFNFFDVVDNSCTVEHL